MEQPDTELLARHMGHDERTHKDFYKRSIPLIQLSKVCNNNNDNNNNNNNVDVNVNVVL